MGSELTYTRERPTVAGWYWQKRGKKKRIVYLRGSEIGLLATMVNDLVWWAGPIPEPEK